MKKLLLIFLIIISLFLILFFFTEISKKEIDANNYITSTEVNTALDNKKDILVYFYKPNCIYCEKATPIITPMTNEMGIDLKMLNLEENPSGWKQFNIEGTPTLIHYKNGQEVSRLYGLQSEEEYKKWFEKLKK
ncbi:thioredoxin family protein [Bacillus toyonensis]|uniref:thioredoxin family protein n=1 Tax=Bacillus toyonensis TaxID=155322 RepID=UPI0028533255|nr:thioredoxin family protein [Bacillus toyonensis]MDR4974608.1 thioredoxin family protein [Bacillus toyonensis]